MPAADQDGRLKRRRYQVSGVDAAGDVHIFESDDHDRAKAVKDQFREDLTDVDLLEDIDLADETEPPADVDRRLRSQPFPSR